MENKMAGCLSSVRDEDNSFDFLFFVYFMQISGKKLCLPAIKSKVLGFGLTVMAPFRWPTTFHNLQLATEVAAGRPNSPAEWDNVAQALSLAFSSEDKKVELTGRPCRERMDRLLNKYNEEDKKSLKK